MGENRWAMEFVVLNAIFRLVFLNKLVMVLTWWEK
jgi:hypothetical protein